MSSTDGVQSAGSLAATIPALTEKEAIAIGEEHLARLSLAERTPPSEAPVTDMPRVRRVARWFWSVWIWLIELIARPWKFIWNPRRPLGRWWAHLRLLAPTQTFNLWKLMLLAFAVVMGIVTYVKTRNNEVVVWFVSAHFGGGLWKQPLWVDISKALFVGAVVGLLAALWNDLFRCPWQGRRIRRHIRRDPASVLHDNLNARPVTLLPREDPIKIVARSELFDELLPGILAREQKDVQIIVGEPGSGKTTAMVSLSGLLARIGIVPVVVPLRAQEKVELVRAAREQFKDQVDRFVRSDAEAETLWRWLYQRRRVAILTDDIDQIGSDGERGFILRCALEEAATRDLPIIVTARPAGVPAGIAASAIDLGPLDERTAVKCVEEGARADPAFRSSYEIPRPQLEDWIREGKLAEVPFYLELLANLAAVNRCPKLPEMDQQATAPQRQGRYRRMPDGRYEWNPLWVRFLLLERFYAEAAAGRVRRWLGIEAGERRCSLRMLEGAALGTLAAAGIKATAGPGHPDEGSGPEATAPLRERIQDFLDSNDRAPDHERAPSGDEGERGEDKRKPGDKRESCDGSGAIGDERRRVRVSAHEAVDTGERLRILDRDTEGALQFRHRIMQAYLAGSRLAVILNDQFVELLKDLDKHAEWPQRDWVRDLLDPHHPEKLTAQMTLLFAALCAKVELDAELGVRSHRDGRGDECDEQWDEVTRHIVERLTGSAERSLNGEAEARAGVKVSQEASAGHVRGREPLAGNVKDADGRRKTLWRGASSQNIDPTSAYDPEWRVDPDEALMKLTAAAEAAHAIGYRDGDMKVIRILEGVGKARYATRWTKLGAIEAIARLGATSGDRRHAGEGTAGGEGTSGTAGVKEGALQDTCGAGGSDIGDGEKPTGEMVAPKLSWQRIWEFARDEDYRVRQAAGDVLCADAYNAYHALQGKIDTLILRAGCRSALGLSLLVHERGPDTDGRGDPTSAGNHSDAAGAQQAPLGQAPLGQAPLGQTPPGQAPPDLTQHDYAIHNWRASDFLSLGALGGALPAIVSGLHEDPDMHPLDAWQGRDGSSGAGERPSRSVKHHRYVTDVDNENFSAFVNRARSALEQLVALGFQGGQHQLEDALARGFKGDAMRHAHACDAAERSRAVAGPGWVAANRRLVMAVCLRRAESWYARLLLNQALALYTVAGGDRDEALDALARHVHRGHEHHPLAQRATRLARAAAMRKRYPTHRWHAFIWDDEHNVAGRRQVRLNDQTAQLAADVDLLLDLNEGSPGDWQQSFGAMNELPHCLSTSQDREEILGKGCPDSCGWNFCPYKQPPPDEPSSQRGVSRAFCRQQRRIARHRRPRWQKRIGRRHLKAFWREMERRART